MKMKNNPLRIWVIPSWYPPNGGSFFREHSQALAKEGADVTVLAGIYLSLKKTPLKYWNYKYPVQIRRKGEIKEVIRKLPIIPFVEKPNYFRWINLVTNMVKTHLESNPPPDILQVHSSIWGGTAAERISKQYNIPYVLTEHRSRFVYNTPEARKMFKSWYYPYLKSAFEQASRIVTVSPSLQDKIADISPEATDKMLSIPNMVDTTFFGEAREEKPQQPFRFFSLAHLEPVKGFDILLKAFAILEKNEPGKFDLVIGGDGSQMQQLLNLRKQLGLEEKVRFTGHLKRKEIRNQMGNAHAFVLPSRFEAFGVVYIEAMASGLPVIASRAGGPETFITPQTGLITEPESPEKLANAMKSLQENYSQYDTGKIKKITSSSFGRSAIARKYLDLYREVLNHKKQP